MANKVNCKVSISWFKQVDKLIFKIRCTQIINELKLRFDLTNKLSEKLESFVLWCANERLNYEPDLDQEVDDYINHSFCKSERMYNKNSKKWIDITKFIFKRDNYTCSYCGKRGEKLECDHIIPFSKGGSDDITNLTTSCFSCNRKKKNMSVSEFKLKYNLS